MIKPDITFNYNGKLHCILDKIHTDYPVSIIIQVDCLNVQDFIISIEKTPLPLRSLFNRKRTIVLINELDGIYFTTTQNIKRLLKQFIRLEKYPMYITTNYKTDIL